MRCQRRLGGLAPGTGSQHGPVQIADKTSEWIHQLCQSREKGTECRPVPTMADARSPTVARPRPVGLDEDRTTDPAESPAVSPHGALWCLLFGVAGRFACWEIEHGARNWCEAEGCDMMVVTPTKGSHAKRHGDSTFMVASRFQRCR